MQIPNIRVSNTVHNLVTFYSDRFDYDWFNDPRHFAADDAGPGVNWSFLSDFINSFLVGVLNVIQRLGVVGALISLIITCIMMMLYSSNKKEMTKHVKNFAKILIAFFLLVSLVSWVSLFQHMLGLDSIAGG